MMKKFFCLLLISGLLLLTFGCGKTASEGGNGSGNGTGSGNGGGGYQYTVKVVSKGANLKVYNINDIKKFQTKSIEVEGKTEEGPQLMTVLKDAGVNDFSKIILKNITNSTFTLTKGQVDENTLLDISNRGTVKLASKIIPKSDWIKDITEIDVEE